MFQHSRSLTTTTPSRTECRILRCKTPNVARDLNCVLRARSQDSASRPGIAEARTSMELSLNVRDTYRHSIPRPRGCASPLQGCTPQCRVHILPLLLRNRTLFPESCRLRLWWKRSKRHPDDVAMMRTEPRPRLSSHSRPPSICVWPPYARNETAHVCG
jgi:hypothetical protein